jgi:hypothetical protein
MAIGPPAPPLLASLDRDPPLHLLTLRGTTRLVWAAAALSSLPPAAHSALS